MSVDIEELRALLKVLAEEDVAEFEHEAGGVRILVKRGAPVVAQAPVPAPRPSQGALPAATAPVMADDNSVDVTSPFVGTFYRAASPEAPPFVEVGSVVRPGQALCIVEAMKLMNEIEAELAGTIVEVYAQNGKPVEFGQKLFRMKKA